MKFKVKDKIFEGGTHIMGILNANSTSFFGFSRIDGDEATKAEKMLKDGAEIIDIGGQSTAPGAVKESALEEASRVLPVLESLRAEFPGAILSVDTFYSSVAEEALSLGADMINDVSCLGDKYMAEVVAKHGASICVMHNRRGSKSKDMWLDKELGLMKATDTLLRAGVESDKIIIDGGIGFNLTHDEDRMLLERYNRLEDIGYPLLLGASRKSFLGGEVESRLTATLDTTKLAVKQGVLFVRVHDVKENKMIIDLYS
ncbi:MAG: dihydropteroate synthase [Clostridia bacterium]|nr:dihydropteroate synthase [Clostridia bacterium]